MGRVQALCSLLQSLLVGPQSKVDLSMAADKLHPLICTCFLFCYVWCLGGNLVDKSMDAFDTFCRDLFGETQDVKVIKLQLLCFYFASPLPYILFVAVHLMCTILCTATWSR